MGLHLNIPYATCLYGLVISNPYMLGGIEFLVWGEVWMVMAHVSRSTGVNYELNKIQWWGRVLGKESILISLHNIDGRRGRWRLVVPGNICWCFLPTFALHVCPWFPLLWRTTFSSSTFGPALFDCMPGRWQFTHFGLLEPFDFELGGAGDQDFWPCHTIRAFSYWCQRLISCSIKASIIPCRVSSPDLFKMMEQMVLHSGGSAVRMDIACKSLLNWNPSELNFMAMLLISWTWGARSLSGSIQYDQIFAVSATAAIRPIPSKQVWRAAHNSKAMVLSFTSDATSYSNVI